MRHKKATFDIKAVPFVVLTLMLATLIGAVSLIGINAFKTNSDATSTTSLVDVNDTFTAINATGVDIAGDHTGQFDFIAASCTNVNIYNGSDVTNVTSYFTISGCTATLNTNAINNTVVTANYTYKVTTYGYIYNISNDGEIGVDNVGDQFGTVGVIIGVALIISVIAGAFAFLMGKKGNAGF